MSDTRHTPGPWICNPDYGTENFYRIWDENGNYHDDTSSDMMDANAKLIAASPLLYEYVWKKAQEGDEEAKSTLALSN